MALFVSKKRLVAAYRTLLRTSTSGLQYRQMRLAILFLTALIAAAQAPYELPRIKPFKVPPVNIGNLGMPQGARKINGRWWTKDNREITQQFGMWKAQPEITGMVFHHHDPFDIRKAEFTHLGMSKEQIQAALGAPNRTIDLASGISVWTYYSANGTSTNVGFANGLVGDVQLQGGPVTKGQKTPRRPATIQRELASRPSTQLTLQQGKRGSVRSSKSPVIIPMEPVAATPKRIVSEEQLASMTVGTRRQEVIDKLGEPSGKFAIAGMDNAPETLTYHLESGKAVELKFEAGKLTDIKK
jgi:hypothetical protein